MNGVEAGRRAWKRACISLSRGAAPAMACFTLASFCFLMGGGRGRERRERTCGGTSVRSVMEWEAMWFRKGRGAKRGIIRFLCPERRAEVCVEGAVAAWNMGRAMRRDIWGLLGFVLRFGRVMYFVCTGMVLVD